MKPEFKIKVTPFLIDESGRVKCVLGIKTQPTGDFVRCGELALTPDEAAELQRKLES